MANYAVTCNDCGNEYIAQLYGSHKTRRYKIENWYGICDECREAKEPAKNKIAADFAAKNLPELIGSPKQIAWATKIRQKAVGHLLLGLDGDDGMCAEIDEIAQHTEAKYWIDNR